MSTILIQLVIAAVIAAAGFAAGVKWEVGIVAARDLKTVQQNARVAILRTDKVDQAAERHEVAKAKIETVYRTITKEVERVVQADPVYLQQCFTDDGLRVARAAIAAANSAAGLPASSVSAAARSD